MDIIQFDTSGSNLHHAQIEALGARAIRLGLSVLRLPEGAKHPPYPWKRYQTSPATVAQFNAWSGPSWAIVTGKLSGVDVVEADDDTACELLEGYGLRRALTSSRGAHYYVKHSGQLRNWANALLGVDVRTEGGLAVGAGSVHKTGHVYAAEPDYWAQLENPQTIPPELLRDILAARAPKADYVQPTDLPPLPSDLGSYASNTLSGVTSDLAAEPDGGRNHALYVKARHLSDLRAGDVDGIDCAASWAACLAGCEANGLLRDDGAAAIRATFDSAWNAPATPKRPKPRESQPDDSPGAEHRKVQRGLTRTRAGAITEHVKAYGIRDRLPDSVDWQGVMRPYRGWRSAEIVFRFMLSEVERHETRTIHPGLRKISNATGLSRPAVSRALDALVLGGLIKPDGTAKKASQYLVSGLLCKTLQGLTRERERTCNVLHKRVGPCAPAYCDAAVHPLSVQTYDRRPDGKALRNADGLIDWYPRGGVVGDAYAELEPDRRKVAAKGDTFPGIVMALDSLGWRDAREVAGSAECSVSTASRHLKTAHEAGAVSMKKEPTKGRPRLMYRLLTPVDEVLGTGGPVSSALVAYRKVENKKALDNYLRVKKNRKAKGLTAPAKPAPETGVERDERVALRLERTSERRRVSRARLGEATAWLMGVEPVVSTSDVPASVSLPGFERTNGAGPHVGNGSTGTAPASCPDCGNQCLLSALGGLYVCGEDPLTGREPCGWAGPCEAVA